jgi:hypothetical protein
MSRLLRNHKTYLPLKLKHFSLKHRVFISFLFCVSPARVFDEPKQFEQAYQMYSDDSTDGGECFFGIGIDAQYF